MKLLVCVKQIVDPESPLVIDRGGGWIDEKEKIALRMNSYDEYALEEAVLLAESDPGTVVEAVTAGPPRARSVLVKALEKGAHNAFHVPCDDPAPTALETAAALARFARGREYDIIYCGVMSEDLMQCATGPALAALLGMPSAAAVMDCEIDGASRRVTALCELEGGLRESFVLPMPCLLTVQSGINRPRYPSLSNVFRAKSAEVPLAGQPCPPSETARRLHYPEFTPKGTVIAGSPAEKAATLLRIFHEKALL